MRCNFRGSAHYGGSCTVMPSTRQATGVALVNTRTRYDTVIGVSLLSALSTILCIICHNSPFGFASGVAVAVFAVAAALIRNQSTWYIFFGVVFAVLLPVVNACNAAVTFLTPRTIDASLGYLDGGLSMMICHFVSHHGVLHECLCLVYVGVPVYAALVLVSSPGRITCAKVLALTTVASPIFYYLFPAVGPVWVGVASAPRNCIPSLHMTWALVLLMYAPPRLRVPAIIFAALTVGATLGLGEHYVIDIVLAVPYTLAADWVVCRLSRWRSPEIEVDLEIAASPTPYQSEGC